MAHRSGEARQQTTLFPVMLDELVGDDAIARVIDAWVGSLDLKALGFSRTQTTTATSLNTTLRVTPGHVQLESS